MYDCNVTIIRVCVLFTNVGVQAAINDLVEVGVLLREGQMIKDPGSIIKQ